MRPGEGLRGGILLACLAWASTALAADTESLPPVPERPEAEQFQDVPEPWRAYMVAVRGANFIEDPLERCLAFPDLPGNRWPQGHAEAHCRYHLEKPIDLDEVEALLLEDNAEGLDALVDGYQQRHGSSEGHSGIIHGFWDQFDNAGEQTTRIAEAWLRARPGSPWANLARGLVLTRAGGRARGGQYARDTPRENFVRMRGLYDQALPYLHKAVELEPAALDAYIGMLVIARVDSRDELERRVFSQGRSIDPACSSFAIAWLDSLAPRWGGSAEAMLAYAESLRPHLGRRPMLANAVAFPYADTASRLIRDDINNQHAADLAEVAARTASHENALRSAAQVAVYRNDGGAVDLWRGTALYLQLSRFEASSTYARRIIGQQLLAHEPEWALAELLEAHRASPGDAHDRFQLAAAYRMNRMFESAERHYLQALVHDRYRREALGSMAAMWLVEAGLPAAEASTRAAPHIDRMLLDDPGDAQAHLLRIEQRGRAEGFIETADIEAFLEVADRDDPEMREAIEYLGRLLEADSGLD